MLKRNQRGTLILFLYACVSPFCHAAERAPEEIVFLECFDGRPSLNLLEERLTEALLRVEGTDVEDDVLLELTNIDIQKRDFEKALPILSTMAENTTATKIDPRWIGNDVPGEREIMLAAEIEAHSDRYPDRSSDHALLQLSIVHEAMGKSEDAWAALEKLRLKHPSGDSVRADVAHLRKMQDLCVAHGTDPRARGISELLAYRPRPHFEGLLRQLDLARARDLAEARLEVLAQLVRDYQLVLPPRQIREHAQEGLDLINDMEPDTEKGVRTLERHRALFRKALSAAPEESLDEIEPGIRR